MHKYQAVVSLIRGWVDSGVLKPGDRLPSIRQMSLQQSFSAITVQNAYALLESEGVIAARPRSGYYVAPAQRRLLDFSGSQAASSDADSSPASVQKTLLSVMSAWRDKGLDCFGSAHPSDDLFPLREMNVYLLRALREEARWPLESVRFEGDPQLCEIIARRYVQRGLAALADDMIVTGSAQRALDLCLDALTRPGDCVLIESPSYFPLFAALERRHLNPIEIYSHPKNGVDPDQFDYLARHNKLAACVLMPVHHFPTGVTYSQETMKKIAEIASRRSIPIIEYDIYSELSHGVSLAPMFKSYDPDDTILHIGSFADTLGPRYGLGWILNRRLRSKLLVQNFFSDPGSVDTALQRAVVQFMQRRSYERHLRRVRETIAARMRRGQALISQLFPLNSAISRPDGGFMCWVRGPSAFDALKAAHKALAHGISIQPGPLFSVTHSFRNFVGLNLSFEWDKVRQDKMARIARLMTSEA